MKLTFHGAAKTVTGSNYLLETDKTKILIDCGLMQGETFADDFNFQPFPYNPKEIDAVIVTHAHIDHTGRIPKLYKEGFRGKIYSTGPTKDFSEQLLLDSEHLLSREAENKGFSPLYSLDDVNETLKLWEKKSYHEKFMAGDLEIKFFDAGHILGSAFVLVQGPDGKRIAFSGDLGNMPAPLVKDTEVIQNADYAVIESTYGNREHDDPSLRKGVLEDIIEDVVKSKGVLMIPAFAMERTQELLFEMNELVENDRIPPIEIYLDSPLAIKLTSIYQKYSKDPQYFDSEAISLLKNGDSIFDFPRLNFMLTTEQSKEINDSPNPKVIIAGSGMSHGGRILHHEFRYLPDPKNIIIFVGYQAQGSLGRRLEEGASVVKIFGEDVRVKAQRVSISGYSAHADRRLLLQWLQPMRNSVQKLFLVHGEIEQMEPFSGKVKDEFAINTVIPDLGQSYEL